jgi:hypothetical protein
MDEFVKVASAVKVRDSPNGLARAECIATEEKVDSQAEIPDYVLTKQALRTWSEGQRAVTTAAGQEPSEGNVRIMHGSEIGGKVTKTEYRDPEKQIHITVEAADERVSDWMRRGCGHRRICRGPLWPALAQRVRHHNSNGQLLPDVPERSPGSFSTRIRWSRYHSSIAPRCRPRFSSM